MTTAHTEHMTETTILVPVSVLNFLDRAHEKINAGGLKKPEHDFLYALLDHSQASSGSPDKAHVTISLSDLGAFMEAKSMPGSSSKSLSRKLKSLHDVGFFDAVDIPLPRGGRPIKKYILHCLHEPDFQTQDQRELQERALGHRNARTRSTKAMLQYLRQSEAQLVSYITKGHSLTDTLFTGVLDRCMRFSTIDKVPGNRITSKLRIKKTDILVQATTQTGLNSQLAALPDQRVIRAIITEVAHFIDSEIERYILDYDGPMQASLFSDSDPDVPGLYMVPSEGAQGVDEIEGQTFESRYQVRREALEQAAADRIRNDFFIDTVNLGRRLEYKSPSSSSTRKTINQSIRRLYDTNFRMMIKSANHQEALEIMRLFGLSDLVTDFRFISSLKSQYDSGFIGKDDEVPEGLPRVAAQTLPVEVRQTPEEFARAEVDIDPFNPDEIMRVRVWRMALDPHLFSMLLNKETRRLFTAHSQIMREHSGLAQTLYNFFSQTIGRSNRTAMGRPENVFHLKLADLHNILWPTRKYYRFQDEFIDLMGRYADHWDATLRINTARMFGYQFMLMDKAPEGARKADLWIRVERDKHDELAGDQSYYNRVVVGRA